MFSGLQFVNSTERQELKPTFCNRQIQIRHGTGHSSIVINLPRELLFTKTYSSAASKASRPTWILFLWSHYLIFVNRSWRSSVFVGSLHCSLGTVFGLFLPNSELLPVLLVQVLLESSCLCSCSYIFRIASLALLLFVDEPLTELFMFNTNRCRWHFKANKKHKLRHFLFRENLPMLKLHTDPRPGLSNALLILNLHCKQ